MTGKRNYKRLLDTGYRVNHQDGYDELISPVTDMIGDNISVMVSDLPDAKLEIDDDGYTVNNLEMMKNSKINDGEINQVVSQFGAKIVHNKLGDRLLVKKVDNENVESGAKELVEAIKSVYVVHG